ncbi:hypothetical protein [Thalassomonas sp. RHCl1]|uniref:hypothetical protein n=1 Tax=Thalassomonas sp. RHCl1 TaxID=2995320 RepID=UPI00248BC3C5|nr:hypothetical protein [Thalassomonas sp. RHCl1]
MSFCQAFFSKQSSDNSDAGAKETTNQANGKNALFESISFNLQSLLQSEAPMVVLDRRLAQIQSSNWRYGVVDIQSNNRFMDADNFALQLAQSIAFSEPRLSQIKVLVIEHPNNKQAVHFHLSANIDPRLIAQYCQSHQHQDYSTFDGAEAEAFELDIDMNTLSIKESDNDNFQ